MVKTNIMKQFISIIKIVLLSNCIFFLNACDDVEDVSVPNLAIESEGKTYKAGEEIKFSLHGQADYIKFYSGEKGNDYAYAYVDRINNTRNVSMSFTTEYQNGGQPADLVRLVYSTNFTGDYTIEGIDNATWVDITYRCTMPTAISNNNNPLGVANSAFDIYDLFPDGETVVYFAYRYHIKGPSSTYGQRTNGLITNFQIEYEDDDQSNVLMTQSTASWKLIGHTNYENEAANALSTNSTRIVFSCAANPQVDKIAYGITAGLSVPKQINQGPDLAVSVKDYQQPQVSSFSYVFEQAGEYEVVFVASNVYESDVKEQVYKMKITITE
jgi:uncharacterized lipoprotein YehR (DUF1307 family)